MIEPTPSRAALALLALSSVGCGSASVQHESRQAGASERWSTAFCSDVRYRSYGTPVMLRKAAGKWSVVEESSADPNTAVDTERVRIFPDATTVCLDAPQPERHAYGQRCWYDPVFGSRKSHGKRANVGYTACNSEFVKCRGSSLDATLIMPLFQFGTFQRLCDPYVRHQELWQALESSGAIRYGRARHRADYLGEFAAARSVGSLQAFIHRYEYDDPESLVPRARTSLSELEAQIEMESRRTARESIAQPPAEPTRAPE